MNLQRRALLAGVLALGAAATPLARAQPAGKVYRVAWFLTTSPLAELQGPEPTHPITRAFVQELRALGYVEGRNLVLERRSAEGDPRRYAPIMTELIALKTDVIVLPGHLPLNRLAQKMTTTIPIVVFAMGSPVNSGLVDSLAYPGGNITGTTVSSGPENEAKRLQLLKETLPGIVRVAYLGTREAWDNAIGQAVRNVAPSLAMQLLHAEHKPGDLEATFAAIIRERPDALFASISAETYAQRQQIVDFARKLRLPGVYPYLEMAAMGGLMAYGVDVVDLGRRAADYVDKILKGSKPGNLPIAQPTKFNLVLNLKTAKALGLTIPQTMLLRADEVIE
ncbi:MAG: ABC transporter substrate-binding protein [Burkholderiales bacterium]